VVKLPKTIGGKIIDFVSSYIVYLTFGYICSFSLRLHKENEPKPRVSEQKESLLAFSSESGLSKRNALCRCTIFP
jgi:hypothetical protein